MWREELGRVYIWLFRGLNDFGALLHFLLRKLMENKAWLVYLALVRSLIKDKTWVKGKVQLSFAFGSSKVVKVFELR